MGAVADAANRWIFPDLVEERWAGVPWIAIPDDPSRATHAVDISGIGDAGVRSLVSHEQYLRALGVTDPVAYATEMLDAQAAAIAPTSTAAAPSPSSSSAARRRRRADVGFRELFVENYRRAVARDE